MKKMIIASIITLNAYAADVVVSGNVYSDNQCAYYASTSGQFKITYKEQLPWGSKVELVYALNDSYHQAEWIRQEQTEMEPIAPYTWQSVFVEQTGSRGEFRADKLNFVFKITLPDGTDYYDNGGQSPMGHYTAQMKDMTCRPQMLELLDIIAI